MRVWACDAVADQPPPVAVFTVSETPVDVRKLLSMTRLVVYFMLSNMKASSAVARLRRSDFIWLMYAFSFVFANFGIAIAARIPMITTTMSSSMSVKPRFDFMFLRPPGHQTCARPFRPALQ